MSFCDKILFVKISSYFSATDDSKARVRLEKIIVKKNINNFR
jgi:hypothetical protein